MGSVTVCSSILKFLWTVSNWTVNTRLSDVNADASSLESKLYEILLRES